MNIALPFEDRRKNNIDNNSPVQRRNEDYLKTFLQSPYISFLESLQKLKKENQVKTIVISEEIEYLKNRISAIFPDKKILIVNDLSDKLEENSLVILNLECRRSHEAFTTLNFDEYIIKNKRKKEPVLTLAKVSRKAEANKKIFFASIGRIKNKKLLDKYLTVTKFKDIKIENDHLISAIKRELVYFEFGKGLYYMQEVQQLEDLERIHKFSENFYSEKFNYRRDVVDVFSDHTDSFIIVNKSKNEIITCARVTWHLPNHILPCMLAEKSGTDLHMVLNNQENIDYIEIYAPYLSSYSAGKVYGVFVNQFYTYLRRDIPTMILTTYNAKYSNESKFLSRYLALKDSNVTLKYGDFGGEWNLVHLTRNMFDENLKLNFISSSADKNIHKYVDIAEN